MKIVRLLNTQQIKKNKKPDIRIRILDFYNKKKFEKFQHINDYHQLTFKNKKLPDIIHQTHRKNAKAYYVKDNATIYFVDLQNMEEDTSNIQQFDTVFSQKSFLIEDSDKSRQRNRNKQQLLSSYRLQYQYSPKRSKQTSLFLKTFFASRQQKKQKVIQLNKTFYKYSKNFKTIDIEDQLKYQTISSRPVL